MSRVTAAQSRLEEHPKLSRTYDSPTPIVMPGLDPGIHAPAQTSGPPRLHAQRLTRSSDATPGLIPTKKGGRSPWPSFGLAAVLLATGPALAQGIDLSNGGPVQVNATGGIDWMQNTQEVIAHGDAVAVRGNVTVTADRLTAHYRKKQTQGAPAKPAKPVSAGDLDSDADGGNQVYRLDADGHVHIFTPTDQGFGDHGTYDMDQSVLVLTGAHLKLITPQDVLTARDVIEYYPQKHIGIARGNAVVVTNDARRIAGDVLVAYTTQGTGNPAPPAQPAPSPTQAATPPKPAKPPADPLLASGKLQRVEAYGNVDIRTPTETVYGDRGVYIPDTGRAHIIGHVHITRGQNQLNGSAAEVDMKTGVATMLSGHEGRVAGLIVPNDAQQQAKKAPGK